MKITSRNLEQYLCLFTVLFLSQAPPAASVALVGHDCANTSPARPAGSRTGRREDERADALRAIGAEVVVGDLTRAEDVGARWRVADACSGMSVSASYLEATVTAAAVAREHRDYGGVRQHLADWSQMSLTTMTDSLQHRLQWLGEQVLNWSGLPVVHVRATVFLQHPFFPQWAAESIARDATIRLPFGAGRTSPVDTRDVAEVVAAVLASPTTHVGKVYELTGPRSGTCMPWRGNTPMRSVELSPMSMCRSNNGGRSSRPQFAGTGFRAHGHHGPAPMPTIDTIGSRTMSRRLREDPRRAAATMSRGTPSCSGQTTRSRRFRRRWWLIESRVGRSERRTVSIGAELASLRVYELPTFSRDGPVFLRPNHQDADLRILSGDIPVRINLRIGRLHPV